MIPFHKNSILKAMYKGVEYHLRYLTCDIENEFDEIINIVKPETASDLNVVAEQSTKLIDLLLVGWSGDGLPEFPSDGKPSKLFMNKRRIIDIGNMIGTHLNEIMGDDPEEIKN